MPLTPIQRLQRALNAVTHGGDAHQLVELARGAGVDGVMARRAARGITINADAYLKLCAAVSIDPLTGKKRERQITGTLDWRRVSVKVLMVLIEGKLCPGKPRSSLRKLAKECGLPFVTVNRAKNAQPISPDSLMKLCTGLGCHPAQFLTPNPGKFHVEHTVAQSGTREREKVSV